jgi:DNA-nicking Smr family endonuclease
MTVRRPGPLGGQRGPLSDEDMRLWEMMKQRLQPLRNAKRRVGNNELAEVAPSKANAWPGQGIAPAKSLRPLRPARRTELAQPPVPAPIPVPVAKKTSFVPAAPPSSTPIEKRKSRQLAKGQRPIEAVLDLHGMRQREAHASLRRFIAASHASGCKFVKVITGKGARLGGDDARDRPFDAPGSGEHGEGERGVLKRLVPEWLREPGIGALVVGISSAGRGHGGEGALYVELRRKERNRPKS